jgi:hypothetical protein
MRNLLVAFAALSLSFPAAAKSAKKDKAQVVCTDGSSSKAGSGACSHHGGIAKDAKATRSDDSRSAKKADERRDEERSAKKADDRRDDSRSANNADERRDDRAKSRNADEPKAKHGGLGSIFGRRDTSETPRSSTRDSSAKSGNATARCKDGSMSFSKHHSGTCSGHGGVQDWLDK